MREEIQRIGLSDLKRGGGEKDVEKMGNNLENLDEGKIHFGAWGTVQRS